MMYNNKLVVALKANGKVLREFGDTVYLPFGCEYSILIKNLNSVRVQATVTVDGTDVGGGSAFIVHGNGEVEITRFITNGNLQEGNRLKFIERSGKVEQHRGVKLDDGLVRVEFQYELLCASQFYGISAQPAVGTHPHSPYWTNIGTAYNVNSVMRSVDFSKGENVRALAASNVEAYLTTTGHTTSSSDFHEGMATCDSYVNDVGITVPGSISNQSFQVSQRFPLESQKHVVVLRMLGETEHNRPVSAPVDVKAKPKCTTCGHVNKANAKFCSQCGTALQIV